MPDIDIPRGTLYVITPSAIIDVNSFLFFIMRKSDSHIASENHIFGYALIATIVNAANMHFKSALCIDLTTVICHNGQPVIVDPFCPISET